MSDSSQIIRFHQTGDASVLQYETLPIGEPGPGQIRIKVQALGLNRAELMFRQGAYLEAPTFPARIGYEASGVVEAIGEGVAGFAIGDEVGTIPAFSMSEFGVYGEHAIVPAHAVAHKPRGLSHRQNAAIWMQYVTAWGALVHVGKLQAGQTLLVTAGSSSVAFAAVQLAKRIGAQVVVTTRGPEKVEFIKQQGADFVIQTAHEDLVERMSEITQGKGADLIFDPVAGPMLEQLAEVAGQGAMIIEYGALALEPSPYPLFAALAKALTIRGYTLFELSQRPQTLQQAKDFLIPLFEAQSLLPVLDKDFPFSQMPQAHEYMQSNQQLGKITVSV